MVCVHCGENNADDAMFCERCGRRLETKGQNESTLLSISPAPSSPQANLSNKSSAYGLSDPGYAPPPQPIVPSSGGMPGSIGQQSPPLAFHPKSRRGLFIVLALIALVVIAAVGAYVYANRSTPEKTLATYCGSLKSGDFQTAYDQLSTNAKGKLSEPQFAAVWRSVGGIKNWTVSNLQENGSTANATLNFTLGNGKTTATSVTLVNENGVWKIDAPNIR